ncbi:MULTISPECIES: hypothetical protein [unclassified Nonomuraea]|uniref:hypothetical protein n=1 Tax=unclassified Nonomuraea TaxID=2593643 RepID=UPI0033C2527D
MLSPSWWRPVCVGLPAALAGPLLASGEELHATGGLGGELPFVLERHRIMYGMQIRVDGEMTPRRQVAL